MFAAFHNQSPLITIPYLKAGIWNFKAIWGGIQDFFINRPFPHSCQQRHQLKAQVDKIQWFVRICPSEPRPHFYVFAHWSIDFSMCNYDNILFLLLNWGSPFHISPVASLGLLLYNLWQNNKLDWTQLNAGKVYWRERGTISKKRQLSKKVASRFTLKKKNFVIQKKKFPDSWLNKNSCPVHGISE